MADPIVGDVKAEGSKVWAWIKDKWPHAVTWLGLAYTFLKAHV
jgi:hypothetical protein